MKLHDLTLSRNRITVDGVELTVSINSPEPTIDLIEETGLSIVTVGIVCDQVVLDGDEHDNPEPTPIYDELLKETNGRG